MTAEEITDPDEAPQYALPLVIRVERTTPPTRTDALEGAARAVLTFLADPRVTGEVGEDNEDSEDSEGGRDGEWAAAARAWEDARIRKVVRRARGLTGGPPGELDLAPIIPCSLAVDDPP